MDSRLLSRRGGHAVRLSVGLAVGLSGWLASGACAQYTPRNLVSDGSIPADHTDPNLVNAWGIAFNPTGVWWVSDNHSSRSTLYDGNGVANSLIVNIPGADGMPDSGASTGIVFNGSDNFRVQGTDAARFLFAGEDGLITAWAPGLPPPPPSTQAHVVINNSGVKANYKGIAIAGDRLFATDFRNGRIDAFDSAFAPITTTGGFTDPNLPAGFAPFNVQAIGSELYVTYAVPDAEGKDDVPGAGNGVVDVFDSNGTLIRRLASQGVLNSPWGLALAPADFGPLSNALLVGNFGDGLINAFDPTTGAPLGTLNGTDGMPIHIDGLWGLGFGNGMDAGPTNTLFFAAGPDDEEHGLFGSVVIPAPGGAALIGFALALTGSRRRR
jgi:uncharacterized protein (TIGR03118 family)